MAKPSAVDSNGSMGQLEADVTNAIWHAFDTLGDGNSGKAAKSRLKVFTSSLGTVLGYTRAEAALEEYCSTQELQFEQYMVYLLKELFQGLPSTIDLKTIKKYRDHIEEVCWLVCKKKYLDREFVAFPEKCVAQLFRVFCFLGELRTSQKDMTEVIMVAEEVEEVTSTFVKALGKEWDSQDFRQLATLLPVFHFQSFLAFLETRYTASSESCGLVEACAEVYDIYVGDVIKKGLLKKKMSTLGLWWEMYFVLRPHSFTYFGTKEGSRKSGEICITSRTRAEPVGDSSTRKGHRFLVTTDDKFVELSASDYKSKLQWMSDFELCADLTDDEIIREVTEDSDDSDTEIEGPSPTQPTSSELTRALMTLSSVYSGNMTLTEIEADMIAAIQTAAQHSYTHRSYQRHLAIKRRNERQACHTRKQEEERQRLQHLAQLEKEKEARRQAEEQLKSEHQKRQELEAAQQELERKLEEERQAKRDEEIVRTLQSRGFHILSFIRLRECDHVVNSALANTFSYV
ncbi:hypothetical protein HPB51_007324 [Rhipicephalus microplus]|uniref:PH domain-containing protein n=1 Tax=Rhipicephalus microplus TaxID=6941 RepID=A0A9J6EY70_RHIMP|nr:hypothetical protein HPB51_007324 [Rhipicephalus microplus]